MAFSGFSLLALGSADLLIVFAVLIVFLFEGVLVWRSKGETPAFWDSSGGHASQLTEAGCGHALIDCVRRWWLLLYPPTFWCTPD